MSYWSRIVNALRSDRLTRDIDEEMECHIQDAIEQGRDPAEAKRSFGSALRRREDSRSIRASVWLDSLRADMVFGWRQLWKNRAASAAAILSLALAMGACIAAFRLIDAMLFRPLPVPAAKQLYILTYPMTTSAGNTEITGWFDYPQFRSLRPAVINQAELIAISQPSSHGLTFGSEDQSEKFWQQFVSGWMFSSFGLKPALGRLFTANDDVKPGAHPVAVLSYDYWTRRFGRDPKIIGRKFRMGTDAYEIVGVCEKGFTGTEPGTVTDIFIPTMMNARAIDNPSWGWFRIWVAVKPGVALELVSGKLQSAVHAFREEQVKAWSPGTPAQRIAEYTRASIWLQPASAGVSNMQKEYRRSLLVLGAVVILVLLIACANLANLMTARAAARGREMAMRVSIGAGRWRLMQMMMVESVLMALTASLLGGIFAWWSAPLVVARINPPDNPARLVLPADWRVLGFAIASALAVTLLFGIIPALRASSVKPVSALKGGEDPHSRRRLMNALVCAQVAFCFLVHFVTGLFVATFDQLSHQPTGFDSDRLLAVETVTRNNEPSIYWGQVEQHLQSVAGVESAAICGWALMTGNARSDGVWVNGRTPDGDEPYFLPVSPGWFETMKVPLLSGRDFRSDDKTERTVVVNQAFARRYFNGRDPVGESFEMMENKKLVRSQIVGSVGDARYRNMRESMRPTVYVPFNASAQPADWATFMVRTAASDPLALAPVIRQQVKRARSEFNVVNVHSQLELVQQHTIRERLLAMLSIFFAAVALVLAGVGLYGVLSYSVLQRRRELGIRIALGAPQGDVVWRVTAEVLAMLVLGAATGLVAGLSCQKYLETLLYQVKGTDLAVLALPTLTVFAAALLASLAPVLHAVKIDPAAMLRAD